MNINLDVTDTITDHVLSGNHLKITYINLLQLNSLYKSFCFATVTNIKCSINFYLIAPFKTKLLVKEMEKY